MKKAKGLVFFVIALLILGLGYTAFAGVYTWYGAREDTIIRGTKSLATGIDLGKTAQIVLTPEEGSEVTAENLEKSKDLIESRLSGLRYNSVDVRIDYTGKQILVTIPLTETGKIYEIQSLLNQITGKGVVTIRKGDETDENNQPTGEIIADSSSIEGALSGKTTDTDEPAVQVYLNKDGTSALTSATYQMSGSVLSIWMDNELLTGYRLDSALTNGKVVITNSTLSMDDADAMAQKINLGPMPFGFTYSEIVELSSTPTDSLSKILVYTGCAFAAVCILLILFYRLTGVIITLALVLESALSAILFTGYFPVFDAKIITVSGIVGMILLGLITVALGIWQAERIKANFKNGVSFEASVKGGLKGMSAAATDGFIIAGITAFFALAAFGTSNYRLAWFHNLLSWLGVNAGGYALYSLPFALLYGLILNLLVVLLIQRVMTVLLSGINAFKKPYLFGGNKDVL